MKAVCKETRQEIEVEPVHIKPGEKAPCALPYHGFSAKEFLELTIKGEMFFQQSNINNTKETITIYKGIWYKTGNNAGYFWHEHLIFKETEWEK